MKLKNRAQLVAAMKNEGFAGPFTLEGIKAFCADAANGVAIPENDIDDLWAKTVTLAADVDESDDDAGDDADSDPRIKALEDQLKAKDADLKALKVKNGQRGKAGDDGYSRAAHGSDAGLTAKNHRNISARKAYDAKAARGETRCNSSDEAEALVAEACLQAMRERDYPQKQAHLEILGKTGSEVVNTAGGNLVPDDFRPGLLYATEPSGVAIRTANVERMKEHTATRMRKTNIFSMNHIGESQTATGTQNQYGAVGLTAKKVMALVIAPTEWIEDAAISVADDLATTFREALDKRIDLDYFAGNGTSTYGGHVGLAKGLPSGAYLGAASATWTAQTIAVLHQAIGSIENVDNGRIKARCSRQWYHQVPVRLGVSLPFGSASGLQVSSGSIITGGPSILGIPVEFVEYGMAVAGGTQYNSTTGNYQGVCCAIGDFEGASMIGLRRDLSVRFSQDRYMDSDQMAWNATARFAINWHGDGRVDSDGAPTSTFGPVVAIVNP